MQGGKRNSPLAISVPRRREDPARRTPFFSHKIPNPEAGASAGTSVSEIVASKNEKTEP
jgi:hypothetical protein